MDVANTEDNDDSGAPPRKKATARQASKVCGVCSDKALGCNFQAISCESCKAFFRRNALKQEQMKCLFDGNCAIDVNTRRFCPSCRLKKCLDIGMKKDLVQGEEPKRKRGSGGKDKFMMMIPSLQAGEKLIESCEDVAAAGNGLITIAAASSEICDNDSNLDTVQEVESKVALDSPSVVKSEHIEVGGGILSIEQVIESLTGENGSDIFTSPANVLSLNNLFSNIGSDSNSNPFLLNATMEEKRVLNSEETTVISQLQQMYNLSFTVDLEPLIHIRQLDPSVAQLINQCSITVLRLIKFAKRMEEFISLSQECQIGILKGSWIHMLLLRSLALYDDVTDSWVTPRAKIPTQILKNAIGFSNIHEKHVSLTRTIKAIIKDDTTIVALLLVITLFSPDGPHLSTREVVSNTQDKYLTLLKHYLEAQYSFVKASELFPQLMSKLIELKDLAKGHAKYLLDVNPREIEPIMLEILDLK